MSVKTPIQLLFVSLLSAWVVHPAFGQTATASEATVGTAKTEVDPKSECKLSGLVVKLAGGEPIRGATVQLQSEEDARHSVTVVTNADGRFSLKGIGPGGYRLRVSRNGFVMQEYGQRKTEDPGSVLTLRPAQEVNDLLFRLVASAVISGHVFNDAGEPQLWAQVNAVRQVYSEGKQALVPEYSFTTNDLGEYRLFGLRPGRYFVTATPQGNEELSGERQRSATDATGEEGYGKTYYPGTPDASKATALTVKAGEEIPSIDIFLRSVSVYRIRGRVYNEILHRPGSGNVFLVPRGSQTDWDGTMKSAENIKSDGTFEIDDVLPGAYNLIGFWSDEAKQYSSRVAVDVITANVDSVQITIGPGISIRGQVVWEGTPSLERDELIVALAAKDNAIMFFGNEGVRVNEKGIFTLANVAEGAYEVVPTGESKDCYLKDVRYGESSALQNGFTVSRGSAASLEVTISSRGARVQGTVVNGDNLPSAGVWVVLIPEPPDRSQGRLYKNETTDQYGHFDIRGIAPGTYKLFSWDAVEKGAWQDAEFLKPFEDKGESITVKESEQKTVNLTTIPTPALQNSAKP